MEPNNVENILDVKNNLGDCPNNIENGEYVTNNLGDCPSNIENGMDVKNILCDDWKPKLGMSFNSEQAAYDFNNENGGRIGFSIRKCYANKSKIGDVTSRLFVCNKEGF